MLGYVDLQSDNQKRGFLVFHYGAGTNLREWPYSGSMPELTPSLHPVFYENAFSLFLSTSH